MDLVALRTFTVVAEELHFGRAARRLHLAQQAASDQIKRLERDLGVELFHRTTRRVELTHAGTALVADAQQLLTDVADVRNRVQAVAAGQAGVCRVVYDPTTATTVLPRVIRQCAAELPGLELALEERCPPDLEQHLLAGRADVGVAGASANLAELEHLTLAVDHPVLLAPVDHPAASSTSVELADVAHEPFIGYDPEAKGGADGLLHALFGLAGIAPAIAQRVSSELAVASLVVAGCGLGIVSGHTAAAISLPVAAVGTEPTLDLPSWLVWDRAPQVQDAGPTQAVVTAVRRISASGVAPG